MISGGILGVAAALSLALIVHPAEVWARCGLGGYGVSQCPDYFTTTKRNYGGEAETYEPPPMAAHPAPWDQCAKTGWGITGCPGYKTGITPGAPESGYRQNLDDCMKTGWGITGCPNWHTGTTPQPPGSPRRPAWSQEIQERCGKAADPECSGGEKPASSPPPY
jgi:hypothetical protein